VSYREIYIFLTRAIYYRLMHNRRENRDFENMATTRPVSSLTPLGFRMIKCRNELQRLWGKSAWCSSADSVNITDGRPVQTSTAISLTTLTATCCPVTWPTLASRLITLTTLFASLCQWLCSRQWQLVKLIRMMSCGNLRPEQINISIFERRQEYSLCHRIQTGLGLTQSRI
jgi:hypothetical protein